MLRSISSWSGESVESVLPEQKEGYGEVTDRTVNWERLTLSVTWLNYLSEQCLGKAPLKV